MLGDSTAVSASARGDVRRTGRILRERYVLETRLELGRFGTLYKAFDRLHGHGGRPYVAILTLPAEILRNPARLGAFRREFWAVSKLAHPNIVELFELDADADQHFVVLEWIDGESLRSIIDSLAPETVCEADALGVVRAVGNALIYAHSKGIVHGDIRPENIVVTEHGEVVVLFTSACLAKSAPFPVSTRDDVRGLAAVAYELMTGTPPPVGGLYGGGARGGEPMPIEGLGKKRWKALKSALSLRDGRMSSVRQLLAALDLEAAPISARPSRNASRRRPDLRRRRGRPRAAVLVGAVGAALALVGGARIVADRLPETLLSEWSARIHDGIDRSAVAARAGAAEVRAGIEWAAGAAASYWERRTAEREQEATESEQGAAERGQGAAEGEQEAVEWEQGTADPKQGAAEREQRAAERLQGADAAGDNGGAAGAESLPERAEGASASAHARGREDGGPRGFDAGASGASTLMSTGERAEMNGASGASGEAARGAALRSEAESPEPLSGRAMERRAPEETRSEPASDARGELPGDAPRSEPTGAGAVYFSAPEYSVSESGGVAVIEVRRTDSRERLSYVWWTRDDTAVSGEDYADLGRVVEQFEEGEAVRRFFIPLISDSVAEERAERFEVLLGVLSREGNQVGPLESAWVTIIDDD